MTRQINRHVKRVKGGWMSQQRRKHPPPLSPNSEQLTLPTSSTQKYGTSLPFRIWRRTSRSLTNGKWWWFRRDPKWRRGPNLIQDLATGLVPFDSYSARFVIHLRSLTKQQIHIRLTSLSPLFPPSFTCVALQRKKINKLKHITMMIHLMA